MFFDEDVDGDWSTVVQYSKGQSQNLGLAVRLDGGKCEWSKWWLMADANRRKLLAQASQPRLNFLDPYLTDPQTRNVPLIVCGDINDGPGLDASEKRLFGSAIERLMGTVWRPTFCLGNALFDALTEKQKHDLDFGSIVTTNFKDPIFDNTYHKEWIDHVLYTQRSGAWVTQATVRDTMADGSKIWKKYPFASDHFPITATVTAA